MKKRKYCFKLVSVFLSVLVIFLTATVTSFAESEIVTEEPDFVTVITDGIVEVARAQIGYYDSNINEFTSWYYGIDTSASWCSIFVSWCADQVGALGTAVPKRASCLSMKNWFEKRGEYYPVTSDYIPQKGDIIFLNTATDGSEGIHHVEIVTQSGFIVDKKGIKVACIGGNTSDLNYNGSEYVTEKIRPILADNARVVGYAHPSYEKCDGLMADIYSFADDHTVSILKYFYAKYLEIIFRFELLAESF